MPTRKKIFIFFLVVFLGSIYCLKADAVEVDVYDDLVMESVSMAPSKPAVNQHCVITVKIKNNGTKNLFTSTGLTSFNFSSGDFLAEDTVYPSPSLAEPISPGGYVYYIFSGRFLTAGVKKLSFIIDKANEMTEKNEDNNSGSLDVTVFNLNEADLLVKEITLSQTNPLSNTNLNISAIVLNSGKTSLTSDAGLRDDDIVATLDGFVTSSKILPACPTFASPLEPGGTLAYVFKGVFNKAGNNNLKFTLDKNQRLAESSESNNSTSTIASVYLSETDRDDFSISDINVSLISSSSVAVSWQTDRLSTGYVGYKKGFYYSDEKSAVTAEAKEHRVVLENLELGNNNYYYRIFANNHTVTKDMPYYNFSLPASDELKLVGLQNLSVDSANKKATLKWETNLLSSGYVYYNKQGDSQKSAGTEILSANHEVILSGLTAGEYYYFFASTSTPGTAYKSSTEKFSISDSVSQEPSGSGSQTPSASSTAPLSSPPSSSPPLSFSTSQSISNVNLYSSLKGKIILKVESKGEAYYVSPSEKKMYYLGRPDDAFSVMRNLGIGISNANLNKIPVGLRVLSGVDSDNDGFSDIFEDAIGTDKNKKDTDNDGHEDKEELTAGFNPKGEGKISFDNVFSSAQAGKIFLQVEGKGEAWYVNPIDKKRYFLGRPADAFNVMRNLGLGISNSNFSSL